MTTAPAISATFTLVTDNLRNMVSHGWGVSGMLIRLERSARRALALSSLAARRFLRIDGCHGAGAERVPQAGGKEVALDEQLQGKLFEHERYVRRSGGELPDNRDWEWRS